MIVQVDRFAWRRASLFAALSDNASEAPTRQANDEIAADRSRGEVTLTSDITADSSDAQNGLFAVRRPE
jgi:hypothetical protein